jgi:hypothetical protein
MAEKLFTPLEDRDYPKIDNLSEELDKLSDQLKAHLNDPKNRYLCKEIVDCKTTGSITKLFYERQALKPEHRIKRKSQKKVMETFKGVYVFGKAENGEVKPAYFGISQNIALRVRGHLMSKNKSIATWAYIMYKTDRRDKNMSKSETTSKYNIPEIADYQKKMAHYYFAFLPIKNDYMMYLLEVYAAVKHQSFWNLFATH